MRRHSLGIAMLVALPLATSFAQDVQSTVLPGRGRRGGQPPAARAQLEQQLRQRIGARVRVVLNLTDDQMSKLKQVDARYEERQTALDLREDSTRRSLRQTLVEAPSPDQEKRAGELFDQLLELQRQRLDVTVAEQKDLSGFLSNTQRARYQALRENMRRQVQDALAPSGGRRGKPPAP